MGVKILTTSDTVTVRGSTNTSSYEVPVTEILAFKPNANSFTVYRNSNYSGYLIRYFNISENLTDLYLADQTYLSGGHGGFNLDGVSYTNISTQVYYYTGTNFANAGFSAPFSTVSVSGRSYSYCSANFNDSWDYEIYVGVNVSGTTYVNGEPLVPPIVYNWQSVPSISGKNGILSLVTLDSEAINDGEPVSGAAVSVFDQAPSTDNNVKDLADTYGSGEESSAVDVTVKYKVTLPPGGAFSVLKLVAKKDSIPEDATDGDKIIDISPTKTKKTVTGLDENSMYYFKIFAEDSNSNTSESDEKHILTSGDEGYNFEYTGEIVEWTVPKTGIYSLETWGAQGGDASDGTLTARGGYGAYAYGEVLLTQGEKLYINVGGQNGYGGGGGYIPPQETIDENKCKSVSFADAYGVDVDYSGWVLDKISVFASFDYLTTGYPLNCYNDGNTRDTITYNNGEVVFNGSNYNLSSIAYALNQTYNNVVAIMFDLSISGVVSGYACGNVDLISISNQKEIVDSNRVSIAYSGTQRNDYDFIAQDGNYHTYTKEFDSPISGVNYIAFDKNGANIAIKNVILIMQ